MTRTLALGAVWIGSAAAAVGLGFLAVSLVDASASPGTTGVAATATPTTPGETSPPPAAPAVSATGEHATEAGTVFANCTGGQPVLAGAPAAGWWIDDSDTPGQVEFENDTRKLEVTVVCGPGGPQFSVEGPRAQDDGDGGEGDGDDGGPPITPAPVPAGPSVDDHGGDRNGGGQGSDDSGSGHPGSGSDDSGSGSGSGGRGSDD